MSPREVEMGVGGRSLEGEELHVTQLEGVGVVLVVIVD